MIKKPVTLQSDLDMESRPIAHLVPVSYTHLDVYKRQVWKMA